MNLHRLALLTGLGSGLEYYAFITFALQAKVLAALFFPHSDSGLVNTFLIFAVGSVVTLVGGYGLGALGDRLGRKKLLLWSVALMTASTVAIGLLPTGLPFGLSVALLVVCRLVQGASIGGEIPGAIVFVYEHAKPHQVGFLLGILFLGIGLGAGISTGVNCWVANAFSPHQVLDFAWRIPFILAIFLGAAGYYLRRKTTESPAFQAYLTHHEHRPKIPVRGQLKPIILGAGLVFFPAILVSIGLYLPSYWMTYSQHQDNQIFLAMMVGFLVTALCLPLWGAVGDRIGRVTLYRAGVVLSVLALPGLFYLIRINHVWALYGFTLIYHGLIVMMAACYPALLAERFPLPWRYRLVALTYAGTYSLAGIAPWLASLLLRDWHNPMVLVWLLLLSGMVSLVAGWRLTPLLEPNFFEIPRS